MHFIQADEISYHYRMPEESGPGGDNYALQKVSLHLDRGCYICILGRNGSGKSTLARHLNALLTPQEGTVCIDGMDSRDAEKVWDIRRTAGMVFQNPDNQMVAGTVEEEVAFGPENLGIPSRELPGIVGQALEEVGLAGTEKKAPQFLSGGEKQRVAIAGVLAMQPKCLILDEATAMLDPRGRKEIMDTVHRLAHKHQMTVINITHFMEEAADADRVYVMDAGKILMEGIPSDIFSRDEDLHAAGLRLPQVCRIARALRARGLPVPPEVLKEEDLVKFLDAWKNENQEGLQSL